MTRTDSVSQTSLGALVTAIAFTRSFHAQPMSRNPSYNQCLESCLAQRVVRQLLDDRGRAPNQVVADGRTTHQRLLGTPSPPANSLGQAHLDQIHARDRVWVVQESGRKHALVGRLAVLLMLPLPATPDGRPAALSVPPPAPPTALSRVCTAHQRRVNGSRCWTRCRTNAARM